MIEVERESLQHESYGSFIQTPGKLFELAIYPLKPDRLSAKIHFHRRRYDESVQVEQTDIPLAFSTRVSEIVLCIDLQRLRFLSVSSL